MILASYIYSCIRILYVGALFGVCVSASGVCTWGGGMLWCLTVPNIYLSQVRNKNIDSARYFYVNKNHSNVDRRKRRFVVNTESEERGDLWWILRPKKEEICGEYRERRKRRFGYRGISWKSLFVNIDVPRYPIKCTVRSEYKWYINRNLHLMFLCIVQF